MANNKIDFTIGAQLDKTGFNALIKELEVIKNSSTVDLKLSDDSVGKFKNAENALKSIKSQASQVEKALTQAFNKDLGTLNIAKLKDSLEKINLPKLQRDFSLMGTQGEKAFRHLASTALTSNLQLKETHTILSNITDTFMKTARWGISSSAFNTFANSIQKSWTYTQALDKSLNSIRIVSGQNADQMEKFAKQANKAAQELGTTTKAYADASLIFYQQGLNDSEVTERTNAVVKMKNVTGEAAEDVSSYMTAIWNNFSDGSKSLEHYADVLTALGASTASSTAEIAAGLEKFASIADTVGLSYDYATASLATVVAETRQSADVVGTAFKTLFSRIQGLNLGETLDDGTTLNKYSKALEIVGISIKEQDGSLKDMDKILEEMGAKWTTLSRDQQTALAQTVAGVRQYNQLMALMNNWEKVQQNINVAKQASGTLDKQNEIYLESYEGHLNKLQAAQEKLYESFYNSDSMKNMIDGLTTTVGLVEHLVTSIGGGGNTLLALGSIATQVFGSQISKGISTFIGNLKVAKENANKLNAELELLSRFSLIKSDDNSYQALLQLEEKLLHYKDLMSSEEYNQGQSIIGQINKLYEQADAWELNIQRAQEYIDEIAFGQDQVVIKNDVVAGTEGEREYTKDIQIAKTALEDRERQIDRMIKKTSEYSAKIYSLVQKERELEETQANIEEIDIVTEEQSKLLDEYLNKIEELRTSLPERDFDTKMFDSIIAEKDFYVYPDEIMDQMNDYLQQLKVESKDIANIIKQESQGASQSIQKDINEIETEFNEFTNNLKMQETINGFLQLASGMGQVVSALQSMGNIKNVLEDKDLTTWEKFTQVVTALTVSLPMLWNGLKLIGTGASTFGKAMMGAAGANATFGASLMAAAPYLLAIAAAVALVTVAIYGLIKAYNADADAAREAAKAAAEAKQSYEEAAEAASQLKESIEEYYTLTDAFNQLTAGADGYTESLEAANEKARELIDTLQLYDKYHYENGLIVIDPDALAEAQYYANRAKNVSQKGMYTAQIYANNAEEKNQQTQLQRKIGYGYVDTVTGQKTDFMTDTSRPVQLSKDSINTIVNTLSSMDKTEANKATASKENFKDFLNGLNLSDEAMKIMVDQIAEQNQAFKDLTDTTKKLNEQNKQYIDQANLLDIENLYARDLERMSQDKNGEVNEGRKHQIAELINDSKIQEDVKQEKLERRNYYNNFEGDRAGRKITSQDYWATEFLAPDKNKALANRLKEVGLTNDQMRDALGRSEINSNEDLARAYAKLKNIDISNASFSWDKFVDASGKTIVDVSSADKRGGIRKTIFNDVSTSYDDNVYNENAENKTKELNTELEKALNLAKQKGADYGTDFSQAALDLYSSKGKNLDISSLFPRLNPDEVASMQNMSNEDITKMFGITNELLEQFGAGTVENAANKIQENLKKYKWDKDASIDASLLKLSDELPDDLSKKKLEEYKDGVKKYASSLMDLAKEGKEVGKELQYDSDAATAMALRVIKMNKAIDKLADGMEDWSDIIKNSSKTSQEYAEAMYDMRDAVADVYDISMDYISNDFITEHLEEIKKIATGSEEAIEGLRNALSEEIVANIAINHELNETSTNALLENFRGLRDQIQSELSDIKIGDNLDDTDFIDGLNKMITDTGMTMEEVNSLMASLKLEPTFETQEMTVPKKEKITQTVHEVDSANTKTFEDGTKVTEWTATDRVIDLGEKTSEDTITVYGISGDGTPPQIKSVKKAPGGSYNNYSSKNKGGKSPGKSGSKGGGSKSKPKTEKKQKDDKDPYHDINIKIGQVEKSLSRLTKQQEKLFGGDLINNLTKQYELLNRQIDNYNQKLIIARQEQQKLRDQLAVKGVSFNEDGTIANYAAAYDAQLNILNNMIERYNAMSAEEQEKFQETLDKAKEDFNEFVKTMQEYDNTTNSIIEEIQDQIQDAINKEIEINITKFNMEIEIRLDLAEATKDWNAFKRRIIDGIKEDNILGNATSRVKDYGIYYNQDNSGIIQANTRHVNDTLAQLKQMDETGWSDFYGDNRKQALEDLKTYYEQLMADLEEVEDLVEEIRQSYLDLMDEAQEKFDEQIENFEFITAQLEHDIALTQLIKGTDIMAGVDNYDLLDKYYSQQDANYQKQIKFQQSQVEFWKEQMDGAEYASKEWDSAREKWMSATSELNSLIETSIENLQTKYLNAIDGIFNNLNNKVTNGSGLDYVSEQWDLINQNADQYLDTVNRAFGIQQLANKYQNAIDLTDSVSAQRKLNKLMEDELKALREKDKLTQYDIDRANKKYEIALKQIALEEAQQNKSKLRLKRDSQGNYSYQYVADDDEVAKLKDEMSGLYNDLYNFDLNRYKENLNQVYSVWDEMQSKMYEVYQDTTLSEEERLEKITLLQEQYGELINGIIAENEVVRINLQESTYLDLMNLYHDNEVAFEGMTTAQTELINSFINGTLEDFMSLSEGERDIMMSEMIPQWNSGVQQMVDTIAGKGGFFPTCKDAFEQLEQKARDLGDAIMTTLGNAKVNFNDLRNATNETVYATQRMIDTMDNLTESYGGQLLACRGVINELDSLRTAYKNAEDASKKAAQAAYEYWAAVNNKAAAEAQKVTQSNQNTSSQPATQPQPASPQGNGSVDVGDTVTYTGGYYYATSYGTGSKGSRGPGKKVTVTQVIPGRAYPIHVQSSDSAYGWLKQSQISGYDTGGYTGEWNNSGRLAFLHQKELVLNAQDTKNMLAAVEIIRKVTDSVGAGLLARMAGLNASALTGTYGNGSEAFEQNVHITAEFPSVTKSSEIENALNNLINTASQRVHSK